MASLQKAYYRYHIVLIVLNLLLVAGCAGRTGGGATVRYEPERRIPAAPFPRLPEPVIRIGLKTDARTLTLSAGGALYFDDGIRAAGIRGEVIASLSFVPEAVTRYSVQAGSYSSRENAATAERTLKAKVKYRVLIREDPDRHMYQLRVGPFENKDQAQKAIDELGALGYSGAFYVADESGESSQLPDLILRSETGELLLRTRKPVRFWSDPLILNLDSTPYRGTVSVFVNQTGRLTAVNVLNFEDYLKGVVPNEIGPASESVYEALKAQAVAARTYAWKNMKQFDTEGYDLCASARCQVYSGYKTEHALTSRAVEDTAGEILTYQGEPINALYTSTCGGRTEDAGIMFEGWNYPYLRSVRCDPEESESYEGAVEIQGLQQPWWLAWLRAKTGFSAAGNLAEPLRTEEAATVLADVVRFLGKTPCGSTSLQGNDWVNVGAYLVEQLCWQNKRDSLLDDKDYQYFLSHLDFRVTPSDGTHSFLFLFHEGILQPLDLARFSPYAPMQRSEYLNALFRILDHYHQVNSREGLVRAITTAEIQIVDDLGVHTYPYGNPLFLFRKVDDQLTPQNRLVCGPGDRVEFLVRDERIEILSCELLRSGISSDRGSKYSFWRETVSPSDLGQRISRYLDVGEVVDLQPLSYGASKRLFELKVSGTKNSGILKGIRIRWALGLKDNLFVIDRTLDSRGAVKNFVFSGRGWGHGVGMCQVGAIGFARMGRKYQEILQHYYSGTGLTRVY